MARVNAANGRIYFTTEDGRVIPLVPEIERQETHTSVTNPEVRPTTSPFKLLTVRRMTNYDVEAVRNFASAAQEAAQRAAQNSGQPVPFPIPLPSDESDLYQYYGLYIDEDLGNTAPIYIFKAIDSKLKAFVTANGLGSNDYSLHLAYYANIQNTRTEWVIYTLDRNLDGVPEISYLLNSTVLPDCFNTNYDINNLQYLGGGAWSGLATSTLDQVFVKNFLDPSQPVSLYREIGSDGLNTEYVIAHSTTPTYQMYWCRNELQVTYRERESEYKLDIEHLLDTGVYKTNFKSNYSLNLQYSHAPFKAKTEYSNNTATYVGTTNGEVNSPFQSPDYGTDKIRYALSQYTQATNVIRPIDNSWIETVPNKQSNQKPGVIPVQISNEKHTAYIYADLFEGTGSISHPFEIKYTQGKRGKSHFYYYKLWFAYGKVLDVEHVPGTEILYRRLNRELETFMEIGKFWDFGELRIHPTIPNAIETTWESDPPAAFFSPKEGELVFNIMYDNPPIMGHQGCHYYHINPVGLTGGIATRIERNYGMSREPGSIGGMAGSFTSLSDNPAQQIASYQQMYGQMTGGTIGIASPSLNIGNVTIGGQETASLFVTQPTEAQEQLLASNPFLFPNGWYEKNTTVTYDNSNSGSLIIYSSDGSVLATYSY